MKNLFKNFEDIDMFLGLFVILILGIISVVASLLIWAIIKSPLVVLSVLGGFFLVSFILMLLGKYVRLCLEKYEKKAELKKVNKS